MNERLIIITGKGGVGKTTLAMAHTLYLHNQHRKVRYNSFYQALDLELLQSLNIPYLDITLEDSAEIYIGNKLNSKTIASWIMHTHFFKSLFQMIPGLGHMILLGHLLKELENDPELIIVLDSPASGHALAMFESSNNFKKIFRAGLIVDDINKMKLQLENINFLKTFVVALPNEMAVNEALELQSEINSVYKNSEIIINNSLNKFCEINKIPQKDIPDFLKLKISSELNVSNGFKTLPHTVEENFQTIVANMVELMVNLS